MPSTAASVGGQLPLRGGDHRGDFPPCQRNRRVDGGGEMISQAPLSPAHPRRPRPRTDEPRRRHAESRMFPRRRQACGQPRQVHRPATAYREIAARPATSRSGQSWFCRFSATSAAAMVLMMSSKAARSKIGNPMSPGAAAEDAVAGSVSLGEVAIFSSRGEQCCPPERLRDMTVHARLSAFLDLLGESLGGHGDDADLTARGWQRANPPRRLQPVHTGHPHIHQDNVEITTPPPPLPLRRRCRRRPRRAPPC